MPGINERLSKVKTAHIWANTSKCDACWDCVEACPQQVIGKVGFLWHQHIVIKNADVCTGCLKCVKTCPNGVFSEEMPNVVEVFLSKKGRGRNIAKLDPTRARVTKTVDVRRQEIIDTARRLFMENGYDKTTIAEITSTLKVAQGLAYYYFKSKQELLYAVIDEIIREDTELVQSTVEQYDGKASDCLRVLLTNKSDMKKYGELFPSLIADMAIMGYVNEKMGLATEPIVLTLIERGNQDGSWQCEYPAETARFILQGIGGLECSEEIMFDILMKLAGVK
jgi:AcrR family transcriptional regulator/NAD-dependent dihydropyrimidine dehydrogenase PreA subunit